MQKDLIARKENCNYKLPRGIERLHRKRLHNTVAPIVYTCSYDTHLRSYFSDCHVDNVIPDKCLLPELFLKRQTIQELMDQKFFLSQKYHAPGVQAPSSLSYEDLIDPFTKFLTYLSRLYLSDKHLPI